MTDKIKQALISNKIDVVSLIEQLCSISAVKSPLFDAEKIRSIDDFWKVTEAFLRVFDYELLWCVIEISECGEAQQIFKESFSKVDLSTVDLVLYSELEQREGSLKAACVEN